MDGAIVQVAHDGTIIYRASGLGSCTKALVAARLEYEPLPPPPEVAARFRRGHEVEAKVVEKMRAEGWKIFDEQAALTLPVSQRLSVVGHIDAKGLSPVSRDLGLVEIKSQAPSAWDAYERDGWESSFFPKYKWQVSVYIHASHLPVWIVRALVDKNGEIVRYEKERIDEPFYSLSEIRTVVLLAESIAMTGVLPKDCDVKMYPCPYWRLHSESEWEEIDDPVVEAAAKDYDAARMAEQVAKGKKDSARKILLKTGSIRTKSGVKVSVYDIKPRSYPDTEAMTKDGVLGKYMKPGKASQGIRVTMPEEGEEIGE